MEDGHIWYYVIIGAFQFLAFLGGGVGFAMRLTTSTAAQTTLITANISALQKDVGALEGEIRKLADVIVMQTQQSARIDEIYRRTERLERWYDDLRRGVGFIEDNPKIGALKKG